VANHVIAVSGQTGESVPLYCTAHGKALLADFDHQQLVALFGEGPLRPYTKQTIITLPQLVRVCTQIKAQGYSTDDGELQEGVRCVAAPIRADGGVVVGSIGISAPATRFPKDRYPICGDQVRAIAGEISARFKVQTREG
jgi:IclR family acetate operon transcriptional repressor